MDVWADLLLTDYYIGFFVKPLSLEPVDILFLLYYSVIVSLTTFTFMYGKMRN